MTDRLAPVNDPDHPMVGATAALIALLYGLDRAAPDPSIEAVANSVAKPRQRSASLFEGYIRRVDSGNWADLRFRACDWRLHVAEHALGDDYSPTVIFPHVDGRGAFSLRFRGNVAAYLDWAQRASSILMLYQR